MRLNPHLEFNGQCASAFRFYEDCLGGKISLEMTYGDSPLAEDTPADWREKILHATLDVGGQVLTGGDAFPEQYREPQGMSVLIDVDDVTEAERIFKELAENGEVRMPLQETFWASRFGIVVDRFGIPWIINCGKPA